MSEFIKSFDERVLGIVTECMILLDSDMTNIGTPLQYHTKKALWDTGADTTIISSRIVKKWEIKPHEAESLQGIGGVINSKRYTIHLGLPKGILMKNLRVLEMSENEMMGYDVIIGMDVISCGDFSITNKGGKTEFMFRIPPTVE